MSTWREFVLEAGALGAVVEARLRSEKHHVLGTLRRDGSPRLSGTEIDFFEDDLVLGMMPGSRKGADLRRDARFALHTNPGDGSMDGGDIKLAGIAVEETDPGALAAAMRSEQPPDSFHLFRLDLREVVVIRISPDGDHLDIDRWNPGGEIHHVDRY